MSVVIAIDVSTAPVTVDEFQNLEFDVPLELVRGEILELTRPGLRHGVICNRVSYLLQSWAEKYGTHLIAMNDTGVLTQRSPDTLRGPDVLAIPRDRLPQGQIQSQILDVPRI